MCEITNLNFHEKYEEIFREISTSNFIAIDCEFSGLIGHKKYSPSLFDKPSVIYDKLSRGNEDFVAFQIGITSFTYTRDEKYVATTYTFHLFPRSYSGRNMFFLCDANSIEFLCEQNFDFNKVFYEGITYTNASNESLVKKEIDDGSLVVRMRRQLNNEDRKMLRSFSDQVIDWCLTASNGDIFELDVSGIEPFTVYLVREEIESRCPNVCTYCPSGGRLRVELTNCKQQIDHTNEVIALSFGFTKLLKDIIAMKKPIIGHNMFTDLLVIYKMFIAPLPKDYDKFKTAIIEIFPEVYDTKYLSVRLKKTVGKKDLWSSNALLYLYKHFKDEKGSLNVLGMPIVEYNSNQETLQYENHHDSGFDSYCTGFVFLKMAHMFSMWDEIKKTFRIVSLGNGPVLYFNAVKAMRNKVNLIRGNLSHISLDGPDPESERPDFILMESLAGAIDISELSSLLTKYDNADIKQLTKRQVLIATSNELSSKIIFKHFRRNKNFRLAKYKTHSRIGGAFSKSAIVLTLVGGIGLASFLVYKNIGAVGGFWEPTRKVNS